MSIGEGLLLEIKNRCTIFSKYGILENKIRIEASSMCQLRCPECPQVKNEQDTIVGKGYLKFKDFKKFVDNHPFFTDIELSNWGEIFLNPELKDILEYAHLKKIKLMAYNGVNLNTVSEDILEALVKYRFKGMTVSIDGASDETYRIYRIGGNFDKVIKNIKRINYYKQVYNTEFPGLHWRFIIFGHNEHKLPAAKRMAKELNMEFFPRLNCSPSYSPVKNEEFVRKESGLGVASRKEYLRRTNKVY